MLLNPCYYSQLGIEKILKRGFVDLNRLYECVWTANLDEDLNVDTMIDIDFLTLDWNVKFLSKNDEERDIEYNGFAPPVNTLSRRNWNTSKMNCFVGRS